MEGVHLYLPGSVSLGGGGREPKAIFPLGVGVVRLIPFVLRRQLGGKILSVFKAVCFCPQSLDVSLRKMTLQLEELLLLKLLQFFGYVQQDDDIAGSNEEEDECLYATQRYFSPPFPLIH